MNNNLWLHFKFQKKFYSILITALYLSYLSFQQFHILRVPVNYFLFKITLIAGQGGSSSPETKHCIFHYRLTCSYTIKKISKMIKMFRYNPAAL